MEVKVGKNAGFCKGVEIAIRKAEEIVKNEKIYCLGEIVHNKQVISDLENKGMMTVTEITDVPQDSSVIFRTHGESNLTYKKAEERNINVYDLTCGNVIAIHKKVEKVRNDSFIIVIGNKNHPEIIGTIGFSGKNSYVIETEEDILDAYIEYEKTNLGKVYVVSQTTFSSKKFDEIAYEIEQNFCEVEVIIDKTICNATENRQKETYNMSKECTVMFIIGGENSSNTRKLFEISKQNCKNVYYIQTVENIKNIKLNENDIIGIMAGASTPKYIIDDIKKFVEGKDF